MAGGEERRTKLYSGAAAKICMIWSHAVLKCGVAIGVQQQGESGPDSSQESGENSIVGGLGRFMRVMVTGGAGFLGSHLCEALVADGCSVVCVDNLLTGRSANLASLRNESRFEFHELDVSAPFDLGAVDFIFDFASPASPVDYMRHGVETLKAAAMARSMRWNWRANTGPASSWHPPASVTATLMFIRKPRHIGEMSIPSVPVQSMTKPNDSQRRRPWPITA